MSEHTVTAYDDELSDLSSKIAHMGGLAEEQLGRALDAVKRQDIGLAESVIASDKQIDALEREIEEQAILLIAKRQPMARDLREVMSAIRIASDLERIGDLAKNIAKRIHALTDDRPVRILSGLDSMGRQALGQLKNVLDAHTERNPDKAKQVWLDDEEVDAKYNSLFRELLTYMMEDPRNIGVCTHLLFGAKNIERIGDHATNIAENVYFLVKGTVLDDERPKADYTSVTHMEYENNGEAT